MIELLIAAFVAGLMWHTFSIGHKFKSQFWADCVIWTLSASTGVIALVVAITASAWVTFAMLAFVAMLWASSMSAHRPKSRVARWISRLETHGKSEHAASASDVKPFVSVQLPAEFLFDYANADGEITSRRVLVKSISTNGKNDYLEGLCLEKRAFRTFRVDRVIGRMTRAEDGAKFRAGELFVMVGGSHIDNI